ncbi:hypothetical protein MAR_022449 [Mya arenaria]|uniref:Uncharacterized protein n=1 Tax=Mya arenaria TaxID=6604 RepID=A0ABY7DN99_MYAAR|nr:hypothetical protein MAR_022449 [Mya arenaria]
MILTKSKCTYPSFEILYNLEHGGLAEGGLALEEKVLHVHLLGGQESVSSFSSTALLPAANPSPLPSAVTFSASPFTAGFSAVSGSFFAPSPSPAASGWFAASILARKSSMMSRERRLWLNTKLKKEIEFYKYRVSPARVNKDDIDANLDAKTVTVTSTLSSDELLAALQKTGKNITLRWLFWI